MNESLIVATLLFYAIAVPFLLFCMDWHVANPLL